MLQIRSINLVNFGKHSNREFEFSKDTTLISGSNGSGKSTIIRAIGLGLFDYKSTVIKDLIRRDCEFAEITIEFEYSNYVCSLYRRIGTEQKTALMINGILIESYRDTYDRLSTLFNIKDLSRFFNDLLYIRSSLLTYLFLLEKSKRKLIIESILDIGKYNLTNKFKDILKEVDFELSKKKENISVGRIQEITNFMVTLEQEIERNQSLIYSIKSETNKRSVELSNLRTELAELETSGNTIKNKIVAFSHKRNYLSSGVCERCGQPVKVDQNKIEELTNQITTLDNILPKIIENSNSKREKIENLSQIIKDLTTNSENINRLLYTKQGQLQQLKQELHNLESKGIDSSRINKLEDLKMLLEKLSISAKDLPAKISNTLIKEVVNHSNRLLAVLPNRNISIDITDYDLIVNINGNSLSYDLLSDGEKVIVALIVRIAMINRMSNLGFYILDEPTINLDESTKEELVNIFSNISGQLLVISHDTAFTNIYSKEIIL